MPRRAPPRRCSDLSEFVTSCRKRLTPAMVGLPTTSRRRTPGLRREEVATLAGVGLTWYTWFEQGRDIQVSEDFLLDVSKALRLDDEECHHLFLLAHRRPPRAEACPWPSVSPYIQQLLDDLRKRPAYVCNLRWDVIAWNASAETLFEIATYQRKARNLLHIMFTNDALRARLPDWRGDAQRMVSQFRRDLASAPDDPTLLRLIDELKLRSQDFRKWFKLAPVEGQSRGASEVLEAGGSVVRYHHETLTVDEFRHLKLTVYFER